jgi:hypothetical protein
LKDLTVYLILLLIDFCIFGWHSNNNNKEIMWHIVYPVFLILHGLVHLLYSAHSLGYFQLQTGLVWPERSWLFSKAFTVKKIRQMAGLSLLAVAIIFLAGGIALFFDFALWKPLVTIALLISTFFYLFLWDGKIKKLHDQGFVGILINIAIFLLTFQFQWPGN